MLSSLNLDYFNVLIVFIFTVVCRIPEYCIVDYVM